MARIWDPLQYGWSPGYWLTIQGTPLLASEMNFGLTPPAGYTDDPGSLVIDEGASVGQRVERDRGIGVGYPLTFRLLDTAAVRAQIKVWTKTAVLQADVSAVATSFEVDSTAGWAPGDHFHIGAERVLIDALAAAPPRFTGCTRHVNGIAYTHKADATATCRITDLPRYWLGRIVELWALPVDPSGYVPGSAMTDDAELVFHGHISAGPDRVGDEWQFEALSLDRVLARPLSSALTGEVIDTEFRRLALPFLKIVYHFASYDFAGALVWSHDLVTIPMATDLATDLLSETEIMSRISTSFAAAAAGTGGNVETIAWKAVEGIDNGQHIKNVWMAMFAFGTDATINTLHTRITVGGWVNDESWHVGGKLSTGIHLWSKWCGHIHPGSLGWVNGPPQDVAAVRMDDALGADVPAAGFAKIGDVVYEFKASGASNDTVFLSGLKTIAGQVPTQDLTKETVEILRTDTAPMPDLLLRQFMSSGTANLRSPVTLHDRLDQTQGYGISETLIHVAGIENVCGALFGQTPLTVPSSGQSTEEALCPLLALSGRALVAKPVDHDESGAPDTSHAYRISMVRTGPSGGSYAATITDAHIIASDPAAVEVRRLGDPPTRIRVQGQIAGEDVAPIVVNDKGREQAQSPSELSFTIPMIERNPIVSMVTTWARARFASDQSAREVDVLTVPWIDAEIGDLVRLTSVHPGLVDLVTGAAGAFDGVARVIGSSIMYDTGVRRWTLLFGGYITSLSLCPSAEISLASAYPPIVNSTIDVPFKYYPHFAQLLAQDGVITLTLYDPGSAEQVADPYGYTFDGVEEVAGVCRLTVASLLNGAEVVTPALSRLATPKTATATTYQNAHLMHDGDGTSWGAGG